MTSHASYAHQLGHGDRDLPTRRHAEASRPTPYQGRTMPSYASISPDQLVRLLGSAKSPVIIDVREDDALAADPRLIPTSLHLPYQSAETWASNYRGRSVAVSCQRGKKLAEGAAAWLRHNGANAEVVEGGFEAWRDAGLPLVPVAALPKRNTTGA